MKDCDRIVPWMRRLMLAVLCTGFFVPSADAKTSPMKATASKKAKEEASRAIPWRDLSLQQSRMVRYIVRNATLYRRMPTRVIDCDPEIFNFLGQHPDVVTELWQMMGVCNLQLEPIGPDTYRATDSAGTTGTMRLLSQSWNEGAHNRVLVYAEGTYEGAPFPRPVTAKSVLLLRSGSTVETNGRPFVTARLDSFILVERLGAELLAKTVQPLITRTADHNFSETMKFVRTFSKTAEKNPSGMARLAQKLGELDPSTQATMAEVCNQASTRYSELSASRRDLRVRLAGKTEERQP